MGKFNFDNNELKTIPRKVSKEEIEAWRNFVVEYRKSLDSFKKEDRLSKQNPYKVKRN